jgi:hypothetical protein
MQTVLKNREVAIPTSNRPASTFGSFGFWATALIGGRGWPQNLDEGEACAPWSCPACQGENMSTVARLTLAGYDRMIAGGVFNERDNRCLELIRGELREMSPAGTEHEDLSDLLSE